MSKVCMITGKRPNSAHNVSHSNRKTKRKQNPNLQWKTLWLPEEQVWVRLRLSTKAIKIISKIGLKKAIKKYGKGTIYA